ncbi:hypothetical protein SH1V18_28660 [Vallitalea longa]|uniref:Uncharacterized protein n=1 Tax=Vallitalea longa TaxID=2936439 RepID=A0A9W5YD31_9FIRM|nr:hypothetical protein [Vallitalea longa]GKX30386.1 hypothetical protein SH1V18_28660 [Vallitalea longa]
MKKILPINVTHGVTSECWNSIRLSAIMSDEKYLPWYIEKFNNYLVSSGDCKYEILHNQFGSTEFICYYDEVIIFENIIDKSNIVNKMINLIDKNRYITLYCDRFYIKGSKEYNKKHYMHEIMIYGFDTNLKEFNIIDLNLNGKVLNQSRLSFDNIECAFYSAIEDIKKNIDNNIWLYRINMPASAFYLNENFNRKPRLELFYDSINNCLKGGEALIRTPRDGQVRYNTIRYGVSIYKSFYEDLYNVLAYDKNILKDRPNILIRFKTLIENKYALIFKINYLNEERLTAIPNSLIDKIKELANKLEIIFSMMTKYSIKPNKDLLNRMNYSFREAEELDILILSRIKKLLQNYMIQRII